jgi:hypothetical protein
MTYDEVLRFVVKQQKVTPNLVTCYEAGAFGFHLHRKFEDWDSQWDRFASSGQAFALVSS